MKYKDLIQFESLDEVVKFNRLEEPDYRRNMVSSYVFSDTYEKTIIPEICRNLDYTSSAETFGLQIVGTYGTGKSHLMSLISLIAENSEYLPLLKSEKAAKVLKNIAGKYKVVRFEMGSTKDLWSLLVYQIDKKFDEWGIGYHVSKDDTDDMYKDKLNKMMAAFEQHFPDSGLMIVIDEMLNYLKSRSKEGNLSKDLPVLQALGEFSDHSKFRFIYGVQEQIYTAAEFHYAAAMLNQVSQRYRPIEITKQDVQFVTQQRILRKDEAQKATVRKHLEKFAPFFPDMMAKMDEYVNLFPVHPAFFENFQLIRIAKSQREILKTLSRKFSEIADKEIPTDAPGLLSYDSYWKDLQVPAMQTYPDIRRISEIMLTIQQKIDENFTGARAKKAPLARRIASLCAVKVLQDSLEKTNGANAETIADDLCYVDAGVMDRDFLIDTIATTSGQIVRATVGQYFEQNNTNREYHLRVEGGVNIEQIIKDFAQTMSDDNRDSYFFNFLAEHLPIEVEQYRREFKIFRHHIEWNSHKVMLDGYIFMGNPSERSTTHPEQNFYIYFMPIFNKSKINHGDESDSVYFHMENVSDEMKELLTLYGAASAKMAEADSSMKPLFKVYVDRYVAQLRKVFDEQFKTTTEVWYQGEKQVLTPAMMQGGSKEEVVSKIASNLLEDYFDGMLPDYPKFTLLRTVLTEDNRQMILKAARQKIANPTLPNRDGEAILMGLGLYNDNQISTARSIYANNIHQALDDKGTGQVLNRDEILHRFYKEWAGDWRSNDYNIPADLEFIVLCAMVNRGEIEVDLQGKTINAMNLREIIDLPKEAFYSFSHIRHPQGMNEAAVKELFLGITGKDLSGNLDNPETFATLVSEAKSLAARAVSAQHDIANGFRIGQTGIIPDMVVSQMKNTLTAIAGLADRIQSFNTKAKLRNLPKEWTADTLHAQFQKLGLLASIKKMKAVYTELSPKYSYLEQALNYIPEGHPLQQQIKKVLHDFEGLTPEDIDSPKVAALRSSIDTAIGAYADWYLAEYQRMHLTAMQMTDKNRLMASEQCKVLDEICSADEGYGYFAVGSQYKKWQEEMAQLVAADSSVAREYLLRNPYARFNPAVYQGKTLPEISALKANLQNLYDNVASAMEQILFDPAIKDKRDQLDESQQALFDRFTEKREELSSNNAQRLVGVVIGLHKNITRITVKASELLSQSLNRPMTPDEAYKAFREYVKDQVAGQSGDVRIIFKD